MPVFSFPYWTWLRYWLLQHKLPAKYLIFNNNLSMWNYSHFLFSHVQIVTYVQKMSCSLIKLINSTNHYTHFNSFAPVFMWNWTKDSRFTFEKKIQKYLKINTYCHTIGCHCHFIIFIQNKRVTLMLTWKEKEINVFY